MHEYNINPLYPTPPPPQLFRRTGAYTPDECYYSWLGPYLCVSACECVRVCVLYQYTLNFDILPSFSSNTYLYHHPNDAPGEIAFPAFTRCCICFKRVHLRRHIENP